MGFYGGIVDELRTFCYITSSVTVKFVISTFNCTSFSVSRGYDFLLCQLSFGTFLPFWATFRSSHRALDLHSWHKQCERCIPRLRTCRTFFKWWNFRWMLECIITTHAAHAALSTWSLKSAGKECCLICITLIGIRLFFLSLSSLQILKTTFRVVLCSLYLVFESGQYFHTTVGAFRLCQNTGSTSKHGKKQPRNGH